MIIPELDRETFNQTLIIKEGTDFSLAELQPLIRDLELSSFGEYIHEEELRMIVQDGLGRIFLALDGTRTPPQLVSYQVILFKQYGDRASAVESKLQPLLEKRRLTDNRVMHDDVHFDEDTTIYFHLIGTSKGYEGFGISSRLKKEALKRLPPEQQTKKRKVCIRINNVSSMVVNMKVLGVVPTSFKPIDLSLIGSRETNFNFETVPGTSPQFDASQIRAALEQSEVQIIRQEQSESFNSKKLLIPFSAGSQSDLADGQLEEMLRSVLNNGYQILGIFRASDLGLVGDAFFYAEKQKVGTSK